MITIDSTIFDKTPNFRLGYLELEYIAVRKSPPEFWEAFEKEIEAIRKHFSNNPLTEDPYIEGMRRLYRAWGIDPARYRPSAERLHRRILKGEDLYRINTAVDVCNIISLRYRLPLGLYDTNKVEGAMSLRYGQEGEKYMGITGMEIGAEKKVVVCDNKGPIGSATTDSQRTAVDESTTALIMLVYAPENVKNRHLHDVMLDYTHTLSEMQEPLLLQTAADIIKK